MPCSAEIEPQHLSCYMLTLEPGTPLEKDVQTGLVRPADEGTVLDLFDTTIDFLGAHGFVHYEISNFARAGQRSAHNLLYWSGKPYLGFGPSAHFYDGKKRSWNRSSLKVYLEGLAGRENISEAEQLSTDERYHDYLITSLRTMSWN